MPQGVSITIRPSSSVEPQHIAGARVRLWDLTESHNSRYYCPDDYPPEMGYLIEWVTSSTLEANHWRACADAEKRLKEEEEVGGAA